MKQQPRFVIVNTSDAPTRRNVAEWVEGVGYCYMTRLSDPLRKQYDGMTPKAPTSLEAFGFAVRVYAGEAMFVRCCDSVAVYEDGKHRPWQDRQFDDRFKLSLVTGVTKKGKAIRKPTTA